MEQREKYYIERLMTANKGPKLSFEEKELRRFQIDNQRDKDDRKILKNTNYELIFPFKEDEHKIHQYNLFISKSREIQEAFIHGKRNLVKDKNVYDFILESAQAPSRSMPTAIQDTQDKINKLSRPKSAIEKNIVGGLQNQKRQERIEDNLIGRKKQEQDHQRFNIMDTIKKQKDEQKSKDKMQKKKIAKELRAQQINQNILQERDMTSQGD